ncbi:thioesterase family protein [Limibacter armeniacum]|uniref:thioesterase family protein n=1 Tax=Limibacter armeniacum TaxID=466084 RepID=UPI002FE6250F
MNLYLRLFTFILRIPFLKKTEGLSVWKTSFYALPSDCDFNFHVTNSRYFSFADLGRFYAVAHMGLIVKLFKNRWAPVVNAQEIVFIRPILPLKKFWVETEILCWDNKYCYLEQRYVNKDGKPYAIAMFRATYLYKNKVVPFDEVVSLSGQGLVSPEEPTKITTWKSMLNNKKQENTAGAVSV